MGGHADRSDPAHKGRYGEAKVAVAGPLVNLWLAAIGLMVAVAWLRIAGDLPEEGTPAKSGFDMLWIFASLNIVLFLFNLLPAPPLDGSHILANFHRGYANLIRSDSYQQVFFLPFIIVFLLATQLYDPVMAGTLEVISRFSGVPLEFIEGS